MTAAKENVEGLTPVGVYAWRMLIAVNRARKNTGQSTREVHCLGAERTPVSTALCPVMPVKRN